jgi:hypothetical protein
MSAREKNSESERDENIREKEEEASSPLSTSKPNNSPPLSCLPERNQKIKQ